MTNQTSQYANDPSYKTLKRISSIMDEAIPIPGTKQSIGLDAFVGLIPGVGDTISVFISGVALFTVARNGLPARLIMAMTFNLLLDYLIGIIPGIGDFIDVFYRANRNNVKLIEGYYNQNPQAINQVQKSSTGLMIFAGLMFILLTSVVFLVAYFVKLVIWQSMGWE
ncbi:MULTISPECIES: DUF4112 domain-containing protein [Flammeovirga]|uniref:DUF4112 domain-containing protein n=1 Tax=Flammeovirga agarivorans TaxID=2726742 RepID=A0A7X8SR06_9BACT|nr:MULTISPECIES: DUF4112 domain-containing protein [Flammeovirga]NLR94811.1 DUF4112 domain-containing protein [Flammeovirga agarivorans]